MTQSVNWEFLGLDRFDPVSPPYPCREAIQNQTLPKAITDYRVSPHIGVVQSTLDSIHCAFKNFGHVPTPDMRGDETTTVRTQLSGLNRL
jgi:hypothetical protein